jgi:Bifunctional DNA primase/polymerase, N-terminal
MTGRWSVRTAVRARLSGIPPKRATKLIGYFTQSVAPLTKTDALAVTVPSNPAIVDTARINPDDGTQSHVLRHANSSATTTDQTHIAVDLGARGTYTYDDADPALQYSGAWSHVGAEQSYTGGDYKHTESFSNTTGDSVTIPFTGTAIRWISSKDTNHGIADVYLDGTKVASVDGYGASKATQQIFYAASGLSDGPHTLKIVVTGQKNPASTGYVVVPPSIHPDSGRPYAWIEAPIAQPPQWLVDLVRQPTPVLQSTVRRRRKVGGTSIADAFTTSKTWAHILQPQGWRCIDPDGDGDGARWLHPAATSACSATVRHGCLFIYSPGLWT